jgi:hypothetical protein
MIDYSCEENIIILFWNHVDIKSENECWNWMMGKDKDGYGKFSIPIVPGKRRHIRAHRFSYFITYGKYEEFIFVCHKCDNPMCVNPKHLFLGSAKDNFEDSKNKNRASKIPMEKSIHRGEDSPMTKLKKEDVLEIKELYKDNNISVHYISQKFNVSKGVIYNVGSGRSWGHIGEASQKRIRPGRLINFEIAIQIREEFNKKRYNKKEIADIYNVDPSTVSRIISNEHWKI